MTLGPGCREFESRHSDQISRNGFMPFLLISFGGARLEPSKCNADERCRRRLDGGEPLSAPLAQMQTSLATRTKSPESASAESGLFCMYGTRLEQSNATRTSVAADGLTEANLYLRLWRRCKRVSPLGPSPYGIMDAFVRLPL